jgi:hypothetical protein
MSTQLVWVDGQLPITQVNVVCLRLLMGAPTWRTHGIWIVCGLCGYETARTTRITHFLGAVPHGKPEVHFQRGGPEAQFHMGQIWDRIGEVPHGWLEACPYEG